MGWRTVVIQNRCKLDLKMGYMVVRAEETKRIFLEEIDTLVIENNAVSFTGCLMEALMEHKVNVLFCDKKRNPIASLLPIYGSHDCSRKLKEQIAWDKELQTAVWTRIVFEKIQKQAAFLKELGKEREAAMLQGYAADMAFGDTTNREGHAAKVYFNAVFGFDFSRDFDCFTNAALNYGYTVLLSAFNREICIQGYSTRLGLHHDNVFNKFNLASDLMEPFRILIDRHVYHAAYAAFGTEEKHRLLSLFDESVQIGGARQTVWNAVKLYTKSVLDALSAQDMSMIKFTE